MKLTFNGGCTMKKGLVILLVLVVAVGAALGYMKVQDNQRKEQEATAKAAAAKQQADTKKLYDAMGNL
jgi:septal ring-binding cell division protein DamX